MSTSDSARSQSMVMVEKILTRYSDSDQGNDIGIRRTIETYTTLNGSSVISLNSNSQDLGHSL